jgi:hypothetical protein
VVGAWLKPLPVDVTGFPVASFDALPVANRLDGVVVVEVEATPVDGVVVVEVEATPVDGVVVCLASAGLPLDDPPFHQRLLSQPDSPTPARNKPARPNTDCFRIIRIILPPKNWFHRVAAGPTLAAPRLAPGG